MLRIAVCDDSRDEQNHITDLLEKYREIRGIDCRYSVFPSGFELLDAVENGKSYDVYCLDILMPGIIGIDTAKEIRRLDKKAFILFATSSADFALASYSVRAVNYLLKPIRAEMLFAALDEILEQIDAEEKDAAIVIKNNEGVHRILIPSLVYAEVIRRSVLYHIVSGKVIVCTASFGDVCDNLLQYGCFVKTHRSFIVNMKYIDTINSQQVTLQTLAGIPVAQGKMREIKEQYLAFQMKQA